MCLNLLHRLRDDDQSRYVNYAKVLLLYANNRMSAGGAMSEKERRAKILKDCIDWSQDNSIDDLEFLTTTSKLRRIMGAWMEYEDVDSGNRFYFR